MVHTERSLCIGEHEFPEFKTEIDGEWIVRTFIDIPGHLIGKPDGFYTMQTREKNVSQQSS